MCSSIDSKVWLISENKSIQEELFLRIGVGSSINYWSP